MNFHSGPLKKKRVEFHKKMCIVIFGEESVDHLFIHCLITCKVWGFFLVCMGVPWIFMHDLKSLIIGWSLIGLKEVPKAVYKYIPGTLHWNVWKERNKKMFEKKVTSQEGLQGII